jgi:hypothetical protein
MSETQQPQWQIVAHIGDVDPIAHGGAFVYEDKTGAYVPEMSWFQPGTDREWSELGGATPLKIYRILLEKDSTCEWWFKDLERIARYTGIPYTRLIILAFGSTREKAELYEHLLRFFGPYEFDSDPITMTEDEAYTKYAEEMEFSRRPPQIPPR